MTRTWTFILDSITYINVFIAFIEMYIDVDILKSLYNVDINNKHLVKYWCTWTNIEHCLKYLLFPYYHIGIYGNC